MATSAIEGGRGRVWGRFAASWGGGALAKSPMQNRSQPNPKNQQTGTKWTPTRQSGTRRATRSYWGGLPCPDGCWGATVSAVRLHLCRNTASCHPHNHALARKHTRSDSPNAVARGKATAPLAGTLDQVRLRDPLAIATSAQVGVRSKQVMNSPLNQYYVTCMLVSRPIEDTTRYRG